MNIKATKLFYLNRESKAQIVINRGGSRSSKTFSIGQLLFLERFFTQRNKKILVLRKTLPSLRISVYQDWKKFMDQYDLYNIVEENKQNLDYYYKPNNNYLHFGSLDSPEKIKSSGWNYIWMNEATDFDKDDLMQLLLRLSEPIEEELRNQLFMCFNPIDEYHWIKTDILDKRENFDLEEIHSTYKDNQFLSKDYVRLVESYQHIDFNKYKVYGLGEWGKLENLIYNNWDTTSEYINNGEVIYGLDFGFTNPSALLKVVINGNDIFEEELIYQTELTNAQLIEKCNELNVSKTFPIYCFHPSTLIRMHDETEKAINNVKIGDILHNNKTVLNVMRREYNGDLLKIKTQSNFEALKCTPDHRIPIIPGKTGRQDKRSDKKLMESLKLVTASEIKVGDYLLIPMDGIIKDIKLKFDGIGKNNKRKKIDFKFTSSIFRLLGYYTAEGSTGKWDTKFYFSLDETETWVKDVVEIVKECFDIDCSVYLDMCPSVAVVAIFSVVLSEFFKYYVNGIAKTKVLHNDLMTMSPEYQRELLIGWLRGDGGLSIKPRNYSLCGTTTSYNLFRQMYLIALRCGLKPSTQKRISKGGKTRAGTVTTCYDVIFSLKDIKSLGFFQINTKPLCVKRIINGNMLVRVKKIDLEKYNGEVIDLDVDGDNLFVAENLLVHNCDSAEPDRIQEFREAGYNVIESVKDVINSIDFVKRFKIHCYKASANLIKEKMGYSRRKDKNGRIYEEPAPNIADHCYDKETQILTNSGWKYFYDLTESDEVMTLDKNKILYEKPIKIIKQKYTGSMIRYDSKNLNFSITPDQLLWVSNQYSTTIKKQPVFDFCSLNNLPQKSFIKRNCFEWVGKDIPEFKFTKYANKYKGEYAIPSIIFGKFLGLWLAEGCVNKNHYSVIIDGNGDDILNIIQSLQVPYSKIITKCNVNRYYIMSKDLYSYFIKLGKSDTKFIPIEYKNGTKEILQALWEGYWTGDGAKKSLNKEVSSVSFQLVSDFQEVLFKLGISSNVYKILDARSVKIIRKIYNCLPVYRLSLSYETKGVNGLGCVELVKSKLFAEEYNDFVYDVRVTSGIIVVRRNGRIMWTSNCMNAEQYALYTHLRHRFGDLRLRFI